MEAVAVKPSGFQAVTNSASSAWDLLTAIASRDVRVRYQGTLFSYIWWVARPLAQGAVLFFALKEVLRLDVPNYSVFLLSAIFPWQWFAGSVSQATGSFAANGGLLKKVRFPRLILPFSSILVNSLQFLLTLPILTGFIFLAGLKPDVIWLLGIPVLFAIQLLLIVGLGTLLASLSVFVRDLAPMLDVVLVLMFYLSAIIYPLDRVPPRFKPFVLLNPVATLLDAWRNLIVFGTFPGLDIWPALALTAAVLVLGFTSFRMLESHFADAL